MIRNQFVEVKIRLKSAIQSVLQSSQYSSIVPTRILLSCFEIQISKKKKSNPIQVRGHS